VVECDALIVIQVRVLIGWGREIGQSPGNRAAPLRIHDRRAHMPRQPVE